MSINEYAQKQIDDITNTVNSLKPLVVINCVTYNHEPYIRDALDGFVMQKTNFPFVAIVHDDASTDGTAAVIREYAEKYPDIIKPIYETENQYSKRDGSLSHIMQEARNATGAKYVAMCEGDDYWTDPLKLQKQVDFLESHADFTMCFHNAIEHWENSTSEDKLFGLIDDREYSGIELYENWCVPTASVIVRKKILTSPLYTIALNNQKMIFGDIKVFLSAAHYGKVFGASFVGSVYRKHAGGITVNIPENYEQKLITHANEIVKVFGKEYQPGVNKNLAIIYFVLFNKNRRTHKYINAILCLIKGCCCNSSEIFKKLKTQYFLPIKRRLLESQG